MDQISMFDLMYPTFKTDNPVRLIELFAGVGSQAMALRNLGVPFEHYLIRQATQKGYIECEIGGVADFSYPTSKLRRGRVQGGGHVCPTLTSQSMRICRIEKIVWGGAGRYAA